MNIKEVIESAIAVANEVIDSQKLDDEEKRIAVSDDPVEWCTRTLGTFYHKKQRDIMYSIRDNRKTAVHAAHGVGKDFCVASFICWWICRYLLEDVMVICTAPSNNQVQNVLFKELGSLHYRGQLPGEVLTKQWKAKTERGNQKVCYGSAPKAGNAIATFQGFHNSHMLIVVDEANGVPDDTYLAIQGMMTAGTARLVAIGNPDFAEGEFYKNCSLEQTGYNVFGVSVFDTPRWTGEECPQEVLDKMPAQEWVDEMENRYGKSSPVYRSKVLGLFTSGTAAGYFPLHWIQRARDYDCGIPNGIIVISADIGRGGDPTVVMLRHGEMIREVTPEDIVMERDGVKVGKCIAEIAKSPSYYAQESGHLILASSTAGKTANEVVIDTLGVGVKPYGECEKELVDYEDIIVTAINAGEKASVADRFINVKAEATEVVHERLREKSLDIDSDDDLLFGDLRSIKMDTSGPRMKVQSKKATAKEIGKSTDHYDALMLSIMAGSEEIVNMADVYAAIQAANSDLERESPHVY